MKILVINGSPKGEKSNTYRLTKSFVEGIKTSNLSDIEIKEINVNRLKIESCKGCFACWNKTPGKCCISDDMQHVIENLLWADITLWSFPLYYFGVPGNLKNLIDRQLPMSLPFMNERNDGIGNGSHPSRYDMSAKKTVIISTCGFYTSQGNYDSVLSMFDHMCGKDNYTSILCGQGELFRVKELSNRIDEYLNIVKTAGKEYIEGNISEETKLNLSQLLYPKDIFEKMADASWGIEKSSGEKTDKSLIFTKQMAALYNPMSYNGKDILIDMYYTDINKKYRITLGKNESTVQENPEGDCTTVIETPFNVWCSIAKGEISGEEAMMNQMYKVKGDFNTMLNWDKYFGSSDIKQKDSRESYTELKPTNMNIMLIPWITFWTSGAINSFWGSIISIAVCTIIPLLFFKNRKTIFDIISNIFVTAISLSTIIGIPTFYTIPSSYLIFGLIWFISGLLPIPLTAHYSMNDYSGKKSLENPIFIKTNRILTIMWGILYIITPIWTYIIMQTDFSAFTGIINSVIPLFMGIFTVWFQKWYPAKVARGK